ncbi:hypothetical protein R1sor_001659 [Riccia sorocarpa]|uniref:Uncharacterized protein n=1 Tax=Riccia sorocarpa TaxID=122646 RepID=A0ABD3GZ24_9MARC
MSPIVEFPPEDTEELIDLTVSKIVETAEEGESSKHNSAAATTTTIEVYRPPGALQTLLMMPAGLSPWKSYRCWNVTRQWAEEARGFSYHGSMFTSGPGSVIEKHFLDQLGCECLKNSWEKSVRGYVVSSKRLSSVRRYFSKNDGRPKKKQCRPRCGQRERALRDKHEKLQREYSTWKEEWEARNQKLVEEVDTLHLDKQRISERAGRVSSIVG